jgi:hypothetical protein
MSIETPERPVDDTVDLTALTRDDDVTLRPETNEEPDEAVATAVDAPPVNPLTTSIAAFLSTASAAWVVGGLFTGIQARLVGILGGLIGAGFVALANRGRRGAALQYFALPLAMVVGAVLVIPDATGGTANLVSLVKEAITSGGLGSPPVPFDPGWRFLVVVVMALLGITSASPSRSSRAACCCSPPAPRPRPRWSPSSSRSAG